MTLLSSVLPGLRELRAPLAAGYLWLLAAWLTAEPYLPSRSEATGLLKAMLELEDAISAVGVAAVLSFAAYLVGSISETVFGVLQRISPIEALARVVTAPRRWWRSFAKAIGASLVGQPISRSPNLANLLVPDPPRDYFTERGERALRDVVHARYEDLDEQLERRGLDIRALLEGKSLEVPAIDEVFNFVRWRDERDTTPEGLLREGVDSLAPEQRLRREIAWRVVRDFGLMRTRLLGTEQELFSVIDRLRAEAEFRAAVVPPLAALVVIGVVRGSWWALLAVPSLMILWRQRTHRLEESGDTLLDLLALGRVQSPALERLDAGIDQLRVSSSAPDDRESSAASRERAAAATGGRGAGHV